MKPAQHQALEARKARKARVRQAQARFDRAQAELDRIHRLAAPSVEKQTEATAPGPNPWGMLL